MPGRADYKPVGKSLNKKSASGVFRCVIAIQRSSINIKQATISVSFRSAFRPLVFQASGQ
jgi:hypothetical protein